MFNIYFHVSNVESLLTLKTERFLLKDNLTDQKVNPSFGGGGALNSPPPGLLF